MVEELLIVEELVLLALHNELGVIFDEIAQFFEYVFIGTLLVDLTLFNKIIIIGTEKKIRIIDDSTTGYIYLDHLLKTIKKEKKSKSVKYWIKIFRKKEKDKIFNLICDSLSSRLILRKEE